MIVQWSKKAPHYSGQLQDRWNSNNYGGLVSYWLQPKCNDWYIRSKYTTYCYIGLHHYEVSDPSYITCEIIPKDTTRVGGSSVWFPRSAIGAAPRGYFPNNWPIRGGEGCASGGRVRNKKRKERKKIISTGAGSRSLYSRNHCAVPMAITIWMYANYRCKWSEY